MESGTSGVFLPGFDVRFEEEIKGVSSRVGPGFFTFEPRLKSGLEEVNVLLFTVGVRGAGLFFLRELEYDFELLRLSEELVLLGLNFEPLPERETPLELRGADRLGDDDTPEDLDGLEGRLTDPPEDLDGLEGRLTDPPDRLPPPEEERPTEEPVDFPRVCACASSSNRKKPKEREKSKISFLFMASPP